MSFDLSRVTFNPWNDFLGVVMQQGRPQLDSDWNEWLAEVARRIQAGTLDSVGLAGYPATTPHAFEIKISLDNSGKKVLTIGPGRMYVDGLLAENHGQLKTAQWDPALEEMSGAPQVVGAAEVDLDYTQQRYLPGATLPGGNGPFLVYLDVWRRGVTHLQDPDLVEPAVGVDTTGRLQTVWQVKLLDVSKVAGGVTCSTKDSDIPPWAKLIQPSAGQLTTGVVQSSSFDVCSLTPNTGFTGRENQLYRVAIHQPGTPISSPNGPVTLPVKQPGTATFKWSRDNASVATGVIAVTAVTDLGGNPASKLTVQSTGKDDVLRFSPNDWVEITEDGVELNGQPGDLRLVSSVDDTARTITVSPPVTAGRFPVDATGHTDSLRHTRVIRWNQGGKVFQKDGTTLWVDLGATGSTGDIPVPPAGTTLILENGITVSFGLNPPGGSFNAGDYWAFAARTTDGSVEPLSQAPPLGIHHHYARLAVATFGSGNKPGNVTDCRKMFPPLTKLTQLHYVSGDGQEAPPGGFLPQPIEAGVANGSFPVAGASVVFRVVTGTGTLQAGAASGSSITVQTGPDGVASCTWQLDKQNPSQRVEAALVSGEALPVRFDASFSGIGQDPGIHILGVFGIAKDGKTRSPLGNDSGVLLSSLSGGIDIDCDQTIDPASVSRPTCFVTIELPLTITANPTPQFPAFTLIPTGIVYQTLTLDADVGVDVSGKTITWRPSVATGNLLKFVGPKEFVARRGILARLTLKGNFIWSSADRSLSLDGEVFGVPGTGADAGKTVLRLPSGDERRGGVFETWFWLTLLKSVSITTQAPIAPGAIVDGMVALTGPPPDGLAITVSLGTQTTPPPGIVFTPQSVVIKGIPTGTFKLQTSKQAGTITITASLGDEVQMCELKTAFIVT